MAKKTYSFNILYLIGMALVIIGFLMPVLKFGPFSGNGFSVMNHSKTLGKLGAFLIIAGGIAGLLTCFVQPLSAFSLIAVIASIAGGVLVIMSVGNADIVKFLVKFAGTGFYLIIAGWIVSLLGIFVIKK